MELTKTTDGNNYGLCVYYVICAIQFLKFEGQGRVCMHLTDYIGHITNPKGTVPCCSQARSL